MGSQGVSEGSLQGVTEAFQGVSADFRGSQDTSGSSRRSHGHFRGYQRFEMSMGRFRGLMKRYTNGFTHGFKKIQRRFRESQRRIGGPHGRSTGVSEGSECSRGIKGSQGIFLEF